MKDRSIQQDAFVTGLKARLPAELRESFSDEQLIALKIAMGARQWGRHKVDFRGTLSLWRWRYYIVVLAGRNRRDLSRLERSLALSSKATLILLVVCCTTLGILAGLYLLKSALGINLFPSFSLGFWDWFKAD